MRQKDDHLKNTMHETPIQRAVIQYLIDSSHRLLWKKDPFTPARFIFKGERLGGKPMEEDVVAVFPTSTTFETMSLRRFTELYSLSVPEDPENGDQDGHSSSKPHCQASSDAPFWPGALPPQQGHAPDAS